MPNRDSEWVQLVSNVAVIREKVEQIETNLKEGGKRITDIEAANIKLGAQMRMAKALSLPVAGLAGYLGKRIADAIHLVW